MNDSQALPAASLFSATDEMTSALNYQGANQSEAEKNLYLTDNRTAR